MSSDLEVGYIKVAHRTTGLRGEERRTTAARHLGEVETVRRRMAMATVGNQVTRT